MKIENPDLPKALSENSSSIFHLSLSSEQLLALRHSLPDVYIPSSIPGNKYLIPVDDPRQTAEHAPESPYTLQVMITNTCGNPRSCRTLLFFHPDSTGLEMFLCFSSGTSSPAFFFVLLFSF